MTVSFYYKEMMVGKVYAIVHSYWGEKKMKKLW
jgi:hypothetical protein